MRCEYEGRFKVYSEVTEHFTKILCRGHADDWIRQLGGRLVEPRIHHGPPLTCTADWPLPAAVPG
jgi:hypothetical protein